MHRVVAWLAAACLLAGCGDPAAELPPSGTPDAAAAGDVVDETELHLERDAEVFSEGTFEGGPAGAGEPGAAADETGEALYRRLQCAGCHEVATRPGQPVIPLARLSERYSPETLAAFLAAPKPPMPSFDLDAEQRGKLAWYLLAAHP